MAPGASSHESELLRQILGKMDDISDLKVQVGILSTQVAAVVLTTKELQDSLSGNGKPGLNDRVRQLEDEMSIHPATCPLKPIVEELRKEKLKMDQEREKAEAEKKQLQTENRRTVVGFLISVIMLALSTAVDVWMYFRGLH